MEGSQRALREYVCALIYLREKDKEKKERLNDVATIILGTSVENMWSALSSALSCLTNVVRAPSLTFLSQDSTLVPCVDLADQKHMV